MLRITFKILPSSTLRLGELLMSYFLLLGIVNIRTSCGELIRHPALPRRELPLCGVDGEHQRRGRPGPCGWERLSPSWPGGRKWFLCRKGLPASSWLSPFKSTQTPTLQNQKFQKTSCRCIVGLTKAWSASSSNNTHTQTQHPEFLTLTLPATCSTEMRPMWFFFKCISFVQA